MAYSHRFLSWFAGAALLALAPLGCASGDPQDDPTPDAQSTGSAARTPLGGPVKNVDLTDDTPGRPVGDLEQVARLDQMPTGVAVSRSGRIFVSFPRLADRVAYTVGEVVRGQVVPFPDEGSNLLESNRSQVRFVSAQSVVVDALDRLWVLDTGIPEPLGGRAEGPKLVSIDLNTSEISQVIRFPGDVALDHSYLNDVRFDLKRGSAGVAYITDSSERGPNGLVIVDLASGRSWRMLNNHPTTRPVRDFTPTVEGEPLMVKEPNKRPAHLTVGIDGLALSADGERLFYSPLASRRLYSVSAAALFTGMSERQVDSTIIDHGDKAGASDGLLMDSEGRLYMTDYEHNAVRRMNGPRTETLALSPQLLWPDSLALSSDGYLYVTASQLDRLPRFHNGSDLRTKPYALFRVQVDASPVTAR